MKIRLILLAGIITAWASSGFAQTNINYDIDLGGLGYGHIVQTTAGIINGNVACGPTAAINSFFFLQTYYGISGLGPNNGLLTLANATNAVNELGVDMGLNVGGVSDLGFISGKTNYLNAHGIYPNIISVEWQSVAVGGIIPTWSWIFDQLAATQDVEVGFSWIGQSGGHWVTATSFHFADANGNGTIDSGETAQLDFIDPWDGNYHTGTLSMTNNYLDVYYSGGAANNGAWGLIDIAVAESPVPEPNAATLLLAGIVGLLINYRRSKKA
jgi:hypothetical protein